MKRILLTLALLALVVLPAVADDLGQPGKPSEKEGENLFPKPGYSPYAGHDFPARVYWGNQHHHTSISLDAAAFGCKLDDEDSYRVARGEEVVTSTGQRFKLSRPMDWLVVTDHAEAYGAVGALMSGDPAMLSDPTLRRWHDMIKAGGQEGFKAGMEMVQANVQNKVPAGLTNRDVLSAAWERHVKTAEKYNEPGRFTAFHGYEWTSMPGGDNLHRNVVFRDDADRALQILPFSALVSDKPEDLWDVLEAYEEKTGGRVLAIPHNPNLSAGRMFALEDFDGKPFTAEYARRRARWEPLVEIVQTKGQSEAAPYLSPQDEFADFAIWDKMNLGGSKLHQPGFYKGEYVREALKNGLKLGLDLGTNPFRLGVVGGTDQHHGLFAVEEENYFGMSAMDEPKPDRWKGAFTKLGDSEVALWEATSAGFAAVWATENTRAALWDAMKRRETYATTGTRMIVRFFGGWTFVSGDAHTRSPALAGYAKGVPMGGALTNAPDGTSPTFLVAALRDPMGANLDRIQIVKGWVDAQGKTQEKVYNVAWGDDDRRTLDDKGTLPAVGSTVNVKEATWRNTIGDPELVAVWADPDFDPAQRAFYYARVIEIPTPRWTCYDAARFGVELPKQVPMTIQERGWTSPIWYTPSSR